MQNCPLDTISISTLTSFKKLKNKLKKIGLNTVKDLLFHFPIRYENRTNIYQISELLPNMYATVKGNILNCNIIFCRRKMMVCQISDGSGMLTIRFFNFNSSMKHSLVTGRHILVYGEIKYSRYGAEMIHPRYHIRNNPDELEFYKMLTPIYPTIKGVNQETLRKLINKALDLLDVHNVEELLPPEILKDMMSFPEAVRKLHYPPSSMHIDNLSKKEKDFAKQRLIFEELLAYNLSILKLRINIKNFHTNALIFHNDLKNKLLNSLQFKLTVSQERVIKEIEHDMALNVPMMRLVQGDVGSGKTLVAALATFLAVINGKQVVLMVPTELLAEQHKNNFSNWFLPFGIKITCLTGKRKGKVRIAQQNAITDGKIHIIIGTHTLLQDRVQFNNLGLVIIDEQHHFGVHQRLVLWEKEIQKNNYPHQLIMTATPIPRTLAMISYANLDISVIDDLPEGRIPITTVVIPDIRRIDIINRIRSACNRKNYQVYWVCTIIEKSNLIKVKAAENIWKKLKVILPELNIGLVHGKMKNNEQQKVIQLFKQGNLHLLVATTVIEVGVDIPNARLIIIENSERLGLAQLHQLRGRVGRGGKKSYCVLLYKSPLSKIARKRLQILRDNSDGFVIAQKDLEIRGPGEVLGTRQSGNLKFKIANFLHNQEMLPEVQRIAYYMYKNYPEKALALIDRWISKTKIHFGS